MPDLDRLRLYAYEDEDGYITAATDLDNDDLEIIQDIIRSMLEVRLAEEQPTIH